jgi:hypothetical protein
MPNIYACFPSKFLKAHELQGKTPTVTIDHVAFEQLRTRTGSGTETKAVLYFRGKEKGLLLNKTNARTVQQLARSPLTEDWAGLAITLYATTATFGLETHDVIRIKAPVITAAPRPTVPPVVTDELEIDLADGGRR